MTNANTSNIVGKVLKQYLTKRQIGKLVAELQDVPGNKHFRHDIVQLSEELQRDDGKVSAHRRLNLVRRKH